MINYISQHWHMWAGNTAIILAVSHAVQGFPTPENKYGAWLVGSIQYFVGQRERALNTLAGQATVTTGITKTQENL